MNSNRIVKLMVVLVIVTLAGIGGMYAGSKMESPADAAARTTEPLASPILVPVERRVLSTRIVARGTSRYRLPLSVAIIPSSLKLHPGVITAIPRRNTQLAEGDVLLSASGRPVFVLQGSEQAYRDMRPCISGQDIHQLESALKRMGHDPGPVDGKFDEQTSAAVEAWYKKSGWEPFGPTPEQVATIKKLERELAVAISREARATAASDASPQTVAAAKAKSEHSEQTASTDVLAKISDRAKIVLNPRSTRGERSLADAQLELARATVQIARLEADVAQQAATDAEQAAQRDANIAAESATRLAADLELAKSKTGIQVPVDEIVFLPTLPVRVEQVDVAVGARASGSVLTVTNNELAIDAALRLDDAMYVTPGMRVVIDEPSLGIQASGVVHFVADSPGTRGVGGTKKYCEILVDKTSTPLQGYSLRLTIPIKSTGESVVAVPVSALSLAPNGTSRVQVETDSGLEYIEVSPGLSADGFVEITNVEGKLTPGQLVVVGYETKE